ncbi:MAG TPA: hypothetical protein ENK85_05895 [Saprospiraceae bacterium]|nr:hypothetical protein [Saprospiraceae bacterium]
MDIKDYLSISGLPGLYKIKASRPNGIIASNLETGASSFVSSRKHQFSPLESIGIYKNDGDTEALKSVLEAMLAQKDNVPTTPKKLSNTELLDYLESVMPDFDRDMVKPRDIKKLISWFHILDRHGDFEAVETPPNETDSPKKDSQE